MDRQQAGYDDSYRDDDMEPRPTLDERLDHIERRLSDLEEWHRSVLSNE